MPIGTSDEVRALFAQGSPLYIKTLVALRHFNSTVYEMCEAVLTSKATSLGESIGISDLDQKKVMQKVKPHLFPGVEPTVRDWDGTKAYIGAKILTAQWAPLVLYFCLGLDDHGELTWRTDISLGFSSAKQRIATLNRLLQHKNSLADESPSYGTDSWLLDFSVSKSLAEIDQFPLALEEVVDRWIENCRAVGGIK